MNLKDVNQEAELGNGSLYITLQRKFNKSLLSKYKQWISDAIRKAREAYLIERGQTLEPKGINKREEM